MPYCWSGVKHH